MRYNKQKKLKKGKKETFKEKKTEKEKNKDRRDVKSAIFLLIIKIV
jgi:hypothetical protein